MSQIGRREEWRLPGAILAARFGGEYFPVMAVIILLVGLRKTWEQSGTRKVRP